MARTIWTGKSYIRQLSMSRLAWKQEKAGHQDKSEWFARKQQASHWLMIAPFKLAR